MSFGGMCEAQSTKDFISGSICEADGSVCQVFNVIKGQESVPSCSLDAPSHCTLCVGKCSPGFSLSVPFRDIILVELARFRQSIIYKQTHLWEGARLQFG